MALLSYAADLYMPLFCSSRVSVVLINLCNVIGIYVLMYCSSNLLQSKYDVPDIFAPNSQDYFRTSLLGFLSPFLLYFIKTFLCNVQSRYLALNVLVEFTMNDWYMLGIIFSLAYPQLQESSTHQGAFRRGENTYYDNVWHIIPRQCYIFGISWSFSEVIISIMETLYNYEEVNSVDLQDTSGSSASTKSDVYDSIRKEIELDKCVSVRRHRSKISSNVYNVGYGSTNISTVPSNNGFVNPDSNSDESTMVINFNTDSMSFLKDIESHGNNLNAGQGIPVRSGSFSYQQLPHKNFKLHPRIQSWRDLFGKLLLSNLIHVDYIISNIGQALIMSMYFIYVPTHSSLFTKPVVYFGSRTFPNFLLCVIVPFNAVHLLFHIFLFTWKDHPSSMEELQHPRPQTQLSDYTFDSVSSPILLSSATPMPGSSPESILYYNSMHPQMDTSYTTDDGRLLRISRSIVTKWQHLAMNPWLIPIGLTLWSVSIFVLGILLTIKFDT